MEKELPSTGQGRSAFTVFGFGGDRYANFDTPLENSANIESFNATNSIAFPSRPTQKPKKKSSDTGDYACKMRLAGPDSSRLVLQSLLPSGSTGAAGASGQSQAEGKATGVMDRGDYSTESVGRHPLVRHYSASQLGQPGLEPAESLDTHADHLLQMFSSRLHHHHSSSSSPSTQDRDLATVAETAMSGGGRGTVGRGLTRQGSSPVLSSLGHGPVATAGVARNAGGFVQGYLARGASSSALHALGDAQPSNSSALATTATSTATASTPAAPDAASAGPLQAAGSSVPAGSSSVDSTDAGMPSSRGFGVLARTRQFGAWLGQVTQGERIEVTKKDINVFAPTSF